MTIEKAMQRIVWRVSNGTHTPNQNDVDAVKMVAEWINRQKTQEIQENRIFAKMYVYCFIHELQFYQNLRLAQKKLHEILKTPLIHLYKDFNDKLNLLELNDFRKAIGLSDLHPLTMTKKQEDENAVLIKENSEDIQRHIFGIWTPEKTQNGLNNQISEAINKYKNLN